LSLLKKLQLNFFSIENEYRLYKNFDFPNEEKDLYEFIDDILIKLKQNKNE